VDFYYLAWRLNPWVWALEISLFIVVLRVIARDNFIAKLACFMLVTGLFMNACVTELNGGVMPVVGMPAAFQPAGPIWSANSAGHLLFIADHASIFFFSIGDLILCGGFAILATCWLNSLRKRYNRQPNQTRRGAISERQDLSLKRSTVQLD